MSYGLDRHRLARHEAGHAVASFLLGRIVTMVTLEHPATGGGASVDRMPYEALGAARRPLAAWYEVESDCLVIFAGPLCETLDHDDEPALSTTPQRVPDKVEPLRDLPPRVPLPLAYQDHDQEPDGRSCSGPTLTNSSGLPRRSAAANGSARRSN